MAGLPVTLGSHGTSPGLPLMPRPCSFRDTLIDARARSGSGNGYYFLNICFCPCITLRASLEKFHSLLSFKRPGKHHRAGSSLREHLLPTSCVTNKKAEAQEAGAPARGHRSAAGPSQANHCTALHANCKTATSTKRNVSGASVSTPRPSPQLDPSSRTIDPHGPGTRLFCIIRPPLSSRTRGEWLLVSAYQPALWRLGDT